MVQQPLSHSLEPEPRSASSRFFAYVQDALWYREFLRPVVATLGDLPPESRILDVGTGPGRLLTMLRQELALDCVGVDTDRAMLHEASQRPELAEVPLIHILSGQPLPFATNSFDAICFCSVLYLLGSTEVDALLQQAQTLLRPHGRIVILTPSGTGYLRINAIRRHWTFHLWHRLTSSTGRQWQNLHLASDFAHKHALAYTCHLTFSDMATVEVLTVE